MDPTVTAIFVVITRAPAPVVASGITRIDDLNSDSTAAAHAIVVSIVAACAELVALPAGTATIWRSAAVEFALEEPLRDGAIVDAR